MCGNLFSQASIERLGQLQYDNSLNDIWAYNAPNGSEYALVGVNNGLSIVDVTEPTEPKEVQFIEGAKSTWRDIKTFEHYAYVVHDNTSDPSEGCLIVDLQFLPDSVQYINYKNAGDRTLNQAHNLYIDEPGYLYVAGHNLDPGGVLIYDLNNTPMEPELVGTYDANYAHDVYVKDNIMYTSEAYASHFAIVDVTNKAKWKILGTQSTFGLTHNAWLSDDGNTLFTTDENSGRWVVAWDVSDPTDIKELSRVQSSPGENVVPHNTHVFGDYLVTSYYKDGVVIFDASDPSCLLEVASFDTSPDLSGSGTSGCWGTTPFLNSGNILASDIQQGLFVLKPTYQKAARLQGLVTDKETGDPIFDVSVSLVNRGVVKTTDTEGFYSTGLSNGEIVNVKFSALGYFNLDTSITLINNTISLLDVSLERKQSFTLSLNIYDRENNTVENADVLITNGELTYYLETDEDGKAQMEPFFEGKFDIYIGKWGFYTEKLVETVTNSSNSFQVELGEGYYDDFTFDYGWTIDDEQTATAGFWERDIPIETTFNSTTANIDFDVEDDYNNLCLITGNSNGSTGADDIDDGTTIIVSPEFEISYWDNPDVMPMLSFSTYFFNRGGEGSPPNDYFEIYLVDGKFEYLIERITENTYTWQAKDVNIKDFVTADEVEKLKLKLVCADESPGHLVEAAFDRFELTYDAIEDVSNFNLYSNDIEITTSANPFTDKIQFIFEPSGNKPLTNFNASIFNTAGIEVDNFKLSNREMEWGSSVSAGVYHLIVNHQNKPAVYLKFIKQ